MLATLKRLPKTVPQGGAPLDTAVAVRSRGPLASGKTAKVPPSRAKARLAAIDPVSMRVASLLWQDDQTQFRHELIGSVRKNSEVTRPLEMADTKASLPDLLAELSLMYSVMELFNTNRPGDLMKNQRKIAVGDSTVDASRFESVYKKLVTQGLMSRYCFIKQSGILLASEAVVIGTTLYGTSIAGSLGMFPAIGGLVVGIIIGMAGFNLRLINYTGMLSKMPRGLRKAVLEQARQTEATLEVFAASIDDLFTPNSLLVEYLKRNPAHIERVLKAIKQAIIDQQVKTTEAIQEVSVSIATLGSESSVHGMLSQRRQSLVASQSAQKESLEQVRAFQTLARTQSIVTGNDTDQFVERLFRNLKAKVDADREVAELQV
jgi:hypothetical protein